MPRKMNPKSLENLEKGKEYQFNAESAVEAQKKSAKKQVENNIAKKAYKEVASSFLQKLIGNGAMETLTDIEAFNKMKTSDKLSVLQHLADYSGQKPAVKAEIDTEYIPPNIRVNGVKI